MDIFLSSLITFLITALISAAIIYVLTFKYKKTKKLWEQRAKDNYDKGKSEADSYIRETYDNIESDIQKINAFSDRQLLVETMLALGTYGRRLDRIDTKIKCITNYETYISDMNELSQKLSQSFVMLQNYISVTANTSNDLKLSVQNTSGEIHRLILALSDLEELHKIITGHVTILRETTTNIDMLQKDVDRIIVEMNSVMLVHDQTPMKKLKKLESDIASIASTLTGITSLSERLEEKFNDTFDEYDSSSVYSMIENISDEVDRINSKIYNIDDFDEIGKNVSEIHERVESALGRWGYDSIYSKCEGIESKCSDIESQLSNIGYQLNN